ncbi:MAG: Nif3-like dinuclear metal center hexameric protein, partial [Bacillus sp. (in: firmicutes)]
YLGADVYFTGDIYYHTAHDAVMQGLNMIDPGHNVEKVMKKGLTTVLKKMCSDSGFEVEIFPSEENTDPFQFI